MKAHAVISPVKTIFPPIPVLPAKTTPEQHAAIEAKRGSKATLLEEAKFVQKDGLAYTGKREYLKYLRQKVPITYREACLAKCYECNNNYGSRQAKNQPKAAIDCKVYTCPLHQMMPYAIGTFRTLAKKVKPSTEHMNRARLAKKNKRIGMGATK